MIAPSLESVLSKEEKENPATEIKDGKSFWNTLLNNGEWQAMENEWKKELRARKK